MDVEEQLQRLRSDNAELIVRRAGSPLFAAPVFLPSHGHNNAPLACLTQYQLRERELQLAAQRERDEDEMTQQCEALQLQVTSLERRLQQACAERNTLAASLRGLGNVHDNAAGEAPPTGTASARFPPPRRLPQEADDDTWQGEATESPFAASAPAAGWQQDANHGFSRGAPTAAEATQGVTNTASAMARAREQAMYDSPASHEVRNAEAGDSFARHAAGQEASRSLRRAEAGPLPRAHRDMDPKSAVRSPAHRLASPDVSPGRMDLRLSQQDVAALGASLDATESDSGMRHARIRDLSDALYTGALDTAKELDGSRDHADHVSTPVRATPDAHATEAGRRPGASDGLDAASSASLPLYRFQAPRGGSHAGSDGDSVGQELSALLRDVPLVALSPRSSAGKSRAGDDADVPSPRAADETFDVAHQLDASTRSSTRALAAYSASSPPLSDDAGRRRGFSGARQAGSPAASERSSTGGWLGDTALRASAEGLFSPAVARRLQDVNVSLYSNAESAGASTASAAGDGRGRGGGPASDQDAEDAEARALLEDIRRLASQIDPEDF